MRAVNVKAVHVCCCTKLGVLFVLLGLYSCSFAFPFFLFFLFHEMFKVFCSLRKYCFYNHQTVQHRD